MYFKLPPSQHREMDTHNREEQSPYDLKPRFVERRVNEFDATLVQHQHHSSNSERVREGASTPKTNKRQCINYMIRQRFLPE